MRKLLLLLGVLVCLAVPSHAQTVLPNLSYNGLLNSTCATPNAFCSNTANPFPGVTGTNGSALDINSNNYAVATVSVSGTYSGATIAFDFSDQTAGTTYYQVLCSRTDVSIIEGSEALPNNQTRAWQCPVLATTRFRVRVSALSSGSINVWITITQTSIDPSPVSASIPVNIAGSTDPCQNSSVLKSSAFANITTATTTALVAPSGTTNIYVCSYVISSFSTATTNTVILENGTGASCATAPSALSPTYTNSTFSAPVIWSEGSGGTLFSTGTSQGLCALSTVGSTPVIFVRFTYVQQ